MSEASASPTLRPDAQLDSYISAFNAHVEDSKQHVLGRSDAYARDHNSRALQSSYVLPSLALWTPREKYAFFAALSRHSRYRTDLIASDIGTKSEAEVLWYLQTLETGVRDSRREHRGHDKTKLDHRKVWRTGFAPAAREISESCILEEERLAQQARDLEATLEDAPRKRRQEREAAFKVVVKDMRQGPQPEGKPSVSQMRQELKSLVDGRCDAEDWLQVLDHEKLDSLDGQMASEWSEWYKARSGKGGVLDLDTQLRLSVNGHTAGWESPVLEPSTTPASLDVASSSRRTYKHDPKKMGRMAAEEALLKFLSDIPARERTAEQEAEIAKLFNKKRSRERYRTKVLISEGMSAKEIDRCGGADKVFAGRALVQPTPQIPEPPSGLPSTLPLQDEALQSIISRNKLDVIDSTDVAIERGWHILHLGRLAESMRRFDVDPSGTELNGTLLDELVLQIKAFLTRLVHATITIAEARRDSAIIPFDQTPETNESSLSGVHAQDVHQALSSRGLPYPGAKLTESLLTMGVEDLEVMRPVRYSPNYLPSGDLDWTQIPYTTCPSEFHAVVSAGHPGSSTAYGSLPEMLLRCRDGRSDALEGHHFIDEDERLDKALDKLDAAYDRLLGDGFYNAPSDPRKKKRKRSSREDDLTDPWSCALGDEVDEEAVSAALDARQAYEDLLRKIGKERRRRIGLELRTRRMNLAELRRETKRRVLLASDWIIFDEDEEDDEEDDAADEGEEDLNVDEDLSSNDGQSEEAEAEEPGSEESEEWSGASSSDEG